MPKRSLSALASRSRGGTLLRAACFMGLLFGALAWARAQQAGRAAAVEVGLTTATLTLPAAGDSPTTAETAAIARAAGLAETTLDTAASTTVTTTTRHRLPSFTEIGSVVRSEQDWEEKLDALLTLYHVPAAYRSEWLKAFLDENSLLPIFHKGGPIMYPLFIASLLAMATVIERLLFIAGVLLRRRPRALRSFLALVSQGRLDDAIALGHRTPDYLVRTLTYALEHRQKSLSNALIFAQERELKRFRRGIPMLDTIITLAPLLGLLGTVTGMMASFAVIGGELSAPGAITGGIAEALIATAYGLGIAITSLLPFNFLNNRMDQARADMDAAATQLELLLHPRLRLGNQGHPPPPPAPPAAPQPAATARTLNVPASASAIAPLAADPTLNGNC